MLGAEVVKVESPKGGEPGRAIGTGPTPGADGYYFMIYNVNKKSIRVDLKSQRGLALVKEMAGHADVFETRGIMQTMQHPRGTLKMPTFAVRFDGAPPRITPAPLLGEHNTTVLGDWLGMKADDVEALTRDGVL